MGRAILQLYLTRKSAAKFKLHQKSPSSHQLKYAADDLPPLEIKIAVGLLFNHVIEVCY
jgi:hypothetical protein